MKKYLKIARAEHVEANTLRLSFSDGKQQVVDFKPFLKSSHHPDIKKYLDVRKFKKFHLEDGELMWGDYELLFPIMDLYVNRNGKEIGLINASGHQSAPW